MPRQPKQIAEAKKSQSMNNIVRVVKEGSRLVVKVPVSLSSRWKQEVCDSFVGTSAHPDVTVDEIGEWILQTSCGCGSEVFESGHVLGETLV